MEDQMIVDLSTIDTYVKIGQYRQAINAARTFGWRNCSIEYCCYQTVVAGIPVIGIDRSKIQTQFTGQLFAYDTLLRDHRRKPNMITSIDVHITEGRILSLVEFWNDFIKYQPMKQEYTVGKDALLRHFTQDRFPFNEPIEAFNIGDYNLGTMK
jgi:hypothetical protein